MAMTWEEQVGALEEVADIVNGSLVVDYSGRGMYGALCYGVICSDPARAAEEAAVLGVRGARFDSMGRQSIAYWPSIKGVVENACPSGARAE